MAVTLYQIANGLAPSGEADEALVESMRSQDVVPLSEAAEALRESEASVNADTLSRVTAAASEMLGQAFAGSGGSLFPGFPFVQYVYARAGVGLTDPDASPPDATSRAFDAQSISASGGSAAAASQQPNPARACSTPSVSAARAWPTWIRPPAISSPAI